MNLLEFLRVCTLMLVWVSAFYLQPAFSRESFDAAGESSVTAELEDISMKVFTYRPQGCAAPSVLVVFHGNGRGAESYRDSAQAVADRSCFVVYSPLFDEDRFPSWRYHRGGVTDGDDQLDPEEWTIELVDEMVHWIRDREPSDTLIYLFGHSAGAQFLSRYAAYSSSRRVSRIILANPSTYVLPTVEENAPYGFGALPEELEPRALMRGYLEAPITIYLGDEDTGSEDLTMNNEARRQGENRLDRGRRTFQLARNVARTEQWEFGWTLVEAKSVGHTARGMLNSEVILEALGFDRVRFE